MKRLDFTFDGIPVAVYPMSEEREEPLFCDSEVAVAFCPCERCDFAVRCFGGDGLYATDPYLPLCILAYFFGKVRRLPDAVIEMSYLDKTYEVDVDGYAGEFAVNSGKCKTLYTKNAHFVDGVEISACVIKGREQCVTVTVADAECFDESRLLLLPGLLDLPAPTPAIAVSFDGALRIRASRPMAYYDAMLYAVRLLSASGAHLPCGRLYAELFGRRHAFSVSEGTLTFYPDIKYLS